MLLFTFTALVLTNYVSVSTISEKSKLLYFTILGVILFISLLFKILGGL